MITPTLQSNPSVLSLNPGESEDSVWFDSHSISQLTAEVLPGITRYLSMREVLVLGQVCRDLRSNLEVCGVITDIRNYLSLPKHKKRSVHQLVTGNRPLIDHLRNNPVGYSKSFPIQHSPAIYIKYASNFRERMVTASSVTLVSSGRIHNLGDVKYCKLNYQHNCLIEDRSDIGHELLHVWTNQKDGSWEREHAICDESSFFGSEQHGADILFVSRGENGKELLSIVKRNELGTWNVTQRLCLNEILRSLVNHCIRRMRLAKNQRLMLCEVDSYRSKNGAILIFGLDDDGRWRTKGRFQFCTEYFNPKFIFSQNCGHVAILTGELFFFLSEQNDRTWINTGEIKLESPLDRKSLKFSVDDHHVVACGQKARWQRSDRSLKEHSHVIVASHDVQGHWSEVLRIDRICDPTIVQSSLNANFSPDGKQLFVCITNQLIILSLQEGKRVSSINLLTPPDRSNCKIRTTMDPSSFMVTSNGAVCIYAINADGIWDKQHEFFCYPDLPAKISSDGDTVVCLCDKNRHVDIWTRRHPDQWIKQQFATPASRVEFSPDGSLVALASTCNLIFLGLTEDRQWQEKGRQRFDGSIEDLSFSPCGRSIRVDFVGGEGVAVTFWQIVPQE